MSQWVYNFGAGHNEGRADMRNLLGGKGANLAEMASIGLPVPPGFTISTDLCTEFYKNNRNYPDGLAPQVAAALARIEQAVGLGFGDRARPLLVSPDHALFCAGHLIPAKALINGTTIRQIERARITYYHIELPRHAVLLAEAAPAESYLDTGNRTCFSNGGGPIALHPAFAQQRREQTGCAPFAEAGPVVEAVRTGLLARAGIVTTADPALAIRHTGGAAIIASRNAIPGHLTPDPRDRRRLGVKIASLSVGGTPIPLDHPALSQGWHAPEPDGRWTDGNACVPAELLAGGRLEIGLAATVEYPVLDISQGIRGRTSFL
jgi:hypothetical protein